MPVLKSLLKKTNLFSETNKIVKTYLAKSENFQKLAFVFF